VVRTAYDGFAAIDAAADFVPHVIVLDIALPKLVGSSSGKANSAAPQIANGVPNFPN